MPPAQNPENLKPLVEPIDYNPAYEEAGTRYSGKGKYKGPRREGPAKMIVLCGIFLLGAGIVAAVLLKPGLFKGESPTTEQASKDTGPEQPTLAKGGTRPAPVSAMGPFPRRMLAINVSNYMYMNPIQYGRSEGESATDRQDFFKILDRMRGSRIATNPAYNLPPSGWYDTHAAMQLPPSLLSISGARHSIPQLSPHGAPLGPRACASNV